ncbi:type II secretion system protein [Spongisporangium articulatum]|uniref:Type II secretion system protein n=1 Tax=Spongisporangium articulatum TaxID=3362603 RepID=A0ABW8AHU5_9ACTN
MAENRETRERGFSLIELLVVMIIIAVLAAIAVPVFLNQRQKARDTATIADIGRLGKAMTGYWVDGTTTAPTIAVTNSHYFVGGDDAGTATSGVSLLDYTNAAATSVTVTGASATAWCIQMKNTTGSSTTYKYSAQAGLEKGSCTSATAP